MKKISMAVCEAQQTYREKLTEYFICKKGKRLQISTFSKQRTFRQSQSETCFDIVLLGQGFERPKEGTEKTLYLRLTEEEGEGNTGPEPSIFKYQPAEEILRQIFERYLELEKEDAFIYSGGKEIIGIYSPCHSRLQTPFALTLAQVFAGDRKVLYVNLGEWAGFGQWFSEEYEKDLSDLIYMINGYGRKLQGMLESVVYSINHMDYIPPMLDAQLLCQTGEKDYLALLKLFMDRTDYETIFLDFGVMVPGFFSLLENCTQIYGIIDSGNLAKGQRQQFEAGLMRHGADALAEKIEFITFSGTESYITEQQPVLQQWLYGALGDRARALRGNRVGAD